MTFLPTTSYESLDAAVQTLREELIPFIGERAVTLFSYAISDAIDCQVCALHFRKSMVDTGEDPDNPDVTEAEQLLIDWGRLIGTTPGSIPDDFYSRLEATFSPHLRVLLVAFAGQLVAMNLFATVGRVPVDDSLVAYHKSGDVRA